MIKFILLGLIVGLVLISGCVQQTIDTEFIEDSPPPKITMQQLRVYGTLTDFQQEGKLIRLQIDSEVYNCEKAASSLTITTDFDTGSRGATKLVKGNKYLFLCERTIEEEPWRGHIKPEGLKGCAFAHRSDLWLGRSQNIGRGQETIKIEETIEGPNSTAVRVIPTIITAGETTKLQILIGNNQDNEIKYRIADAKIVNVDASRWDAAWYEEPPFEERLKKATINECGVSFDSSETIISANSNKILTFTINCPKDVKTTRTFEVCETNKWDQKPEPECRRVTSDTLMLWGEIGFVDELGNEHVFPEKGVLKQDLILEQE